jgi:transcriptional regulator GlxA family with amidase domain
MQSGESLAKWRLKRTIDYVEACLGEPIRIADMTEAAGCTRTNFSAQFRTSTGLRPHEYLLRRRIERAQEMLLVAWPSVVDIALAMEFQTQSHFTATFMCLVGLTPHVWRLEQGARRSRGQQKIGPGAVR